MVKKTGPREPYVLGIETMRNKLLIKMYSCHIVASVEKMECWGAVELKIRGQDRSYRKDNYVKLERGEVLSHMNAWEGSISDSGDSECNVEVCLHCS